MTNMDISNKTDVENTRTEKIREDMPRFFQDIKSDEHVDITKPVADHLEGDFDDTGKRYKDNGSLLPNSEYTLKKYTYKTDEFGRKTSWKGEPGYNPEAERDENAQVEAGGEDRREGDDGGHLVARVLDGTSGNENIVPMRATVNRGDYKKGECEIAKAVSNRLTVLDEGKIIYDDESERPSSIERTYVIEGEKRVLVVDNIEGGQDLLEQVSDEINEDDYDNLSDRIKDMEASGCVVSVTSIYKRYDASGKLNAVRVGFRDETNKNRYYTEYKAKYDGSK